MLKKGMVVPEDVGAFFDKCCEKAEEEPLLIAYDDAKQLLGSSSRAREATGEAGGQGNGESPILEEFRRQVDRLADFKHCAQCRCGGYCKCRRYRLRNRLRYSLCHSR